MVMVRVSCEKIGGGYVFRDSCVLTRLAICMHNQVS